MCTKANKHVHKVQKIHATEQNAKLLINVQKKQKNESI
jgi:hypothetical protein